MGRKAFISASKGYPLRHGKHRRFDPAHPDRVHYVDSDADNDERLKQRLPVYSRQHRKISSVPIGYTTRSFRTKTDPRVDKFDEFLGWDMVVTDDTIEGERVINHFASGKSLNVSAGYRPTGDVFAMDHVALTDIPYYEVCVTDKVITCSDDAATSGDHLTKHRIIMSDTRETDAPPAEPQAPDSAPPAEPAATPAVPLDSGDRYRDFFKQSQSKTIEAFDRFLTEAQIEAGPSTEIFKDKIIGDINADKPRQVLTTLLGAFHELQELKQKKAVPDTRSMMEEASSNPVATSDHSRAGTSGHPFASNWEKEFLAGLDEAVINDRIVPVSRGSE